MKKLGLIVALLTLFAFLPGLIGCATPTTPTTATKTTASATSVAPTTTAFKPIVLKYADQRAHKYGQYYDNTVENCLYIRWINAVEAVTNGRIKFEDYPSESLFPLTVAEVSTAQGLADACYSSRVTPGVLPMMDVTTLPTLGQFQALSSVEEGMIHWFFLWKYFDKDQAAMNLIDLAPLPLETYDFASAKKPLRGIADIKGETFMSTRVWETKLITELGGIVVPISLVQGYDALSKGVADAWSWTRGGPWLFGYLDAMKPGYFVDSGGTIMAAGNSMNFLMNRTKYNSIPKDILGPMEDALFYWGTLYNGEEDQLQDPALQKQGEARGVQYISWSAEDKAKLQAVKDKMADAWVAEIESKYKRGAEATELINVFKNAISIYQPPAPMQAEHPVSGHDVAKWESVWGKPDSTWGRGYKPYPNMVGAIGNHQLQDNKFQAWPK